MCGFIMEHMLFSDEKKRTVQQMSVCLIEKDQFKPLWELFIKSEWWAKIHPTQVGSRGVIDIPSLDPLFKFIAMNQNQCI